MLDLVGNTHDVIPNSHLMQITQAAQTTRSSLLPRAGHCLFVYGKVIRNSFKIRISLCSYIYHPMMKDGDAPGLQPVLRCEPHKESWTSFPGRWKRRVHLYPVTRKVQPQPPPRTPSPAPGLLLLSAILFHFRFDF